jgi:hypothetical protein
MKYTISALGLRRRSTIGMDYGHKYEKHSSEFEGRSWCQWRYLGSDFLKIPALVFIPLELVPGPGDHFEFIDIVPVPISNPASFGCKIIPDNTVAVIEGWRLRECIWRQHCYLHAFNFSQKWTARPKGEMGNWLTRDACAGDETRPSLNP